MKSATLRLLAATTSVAACALLALTTRAADAPSSPLPSSASAATFTNPLGDGADPWVIRHDGHYYWCFAGDGGRTVFVHRSDRLTTLGEKTAVWRAPATGPHSRQLWAPELHRLDGGWFIYVAASDGKNENHRMIVLAATTPDPLGPYEFKGELYTGDHLSTRAHNRWAIDATILEHRGQRYVLWSGWHDERDEQFLYIATLSNPWTVSSNRVRLASNHDYLWERVGEKLTERGLHEAPQVLTRAGRVFVVYSCSGGWQATYKLGLLTLAPDGDPMNPAAWTKSAQPVFQSDAHTFGVGHNCFAQSPDGREDWLIYHAKKSRAEGWPRTIRAQPFTWHPDGTPNFGSPIPAGTPLPLPSGQRTP